MEIQAFEQLKIELTKHPVLKLFKFRAKTELHTDASKEGYGAVMLQQDDENGNMHPVCYMSRKTRTAEQKYHSYELEAMAVINAFNKWRSYVLGEHVKVITDRNAFALTMKKIDIPVRVARWAIYLQDFDYEIEHRAGTKMRHVDSLSRNILMIDTAISHRIKTAQEEDEYLIAIKTILNDHSYNDYFLKNEIIFKMINGVELLVIPGWVLNPGLQNPAHIIPLTQSRISESRITICFLFSS